MAQSTEDYLDSLLRQAMGIPDPEPAAKPAEHPADLERDSVLEMADGLTGSNSAILGNVYDHNASFTNEGEIEIPSAPAAETGPVSESQQTNAPVQAAEIPAEEMPDPDAPPVIGRTIAEDTSMITEDLLPNIDDVLTSPENQEPAVAEEPAIPMPETDPVVIPDAPVFEPDGNLDLIPEPIHEELVMPSFEEPVISEPAADVTAAGTYMPEEPVIEVPVMEEPVVEIPVTEEPIIETAVTEEPAAEVPVIEEPIPEPIAEPISEPAAEPIEEPVAEEPAVEEPAVEVPVTEELIPEPAAEPIPEPVAEPVAEPVEEIAEPSLSIDDLDPNDSTKALDADTIAALFAGANAEEPVAEEPAVEEPAVEAPVTEEPIPEPVAEPVAKEPSAPSLSIDDLDPNDSSKALDADTIAALFASANEEEAAVEEPVPEEPVAEEPAAEEQPAEEPAAEEQPAEEPAAEEVAAEESAAPALSIDDLDPNDSSKALDPDTIAALFAGANAEGTAEETAEEEPVAGEEPALEEPAIEEPAIEETVVEEETAEEPETEETLAEEPAGDDPEINEPLTPSLEGQELEELVGLPSDDETEEPLMPDQEISDLLSSLGEITGEDEEGAADEAAAEEAAAEAGDAEEGADDSALDLGGIDMFDTDLSAMLDDVTGSLDSPDGGETAASDDSDLNDLLGSLDDGSGDLSDIGSLLEKDENSELVDPNTETAEALFASDSEEQIFDIDSPIDEEEQGGKKKKKRSKLFGRKKDKGNVEVIGQDEELLVDPSMLDIPDESELKKKKGGFFANLFAKLFEEIGEDEDDAGASGIEQSAVDIAQEGAEENASIIAELDEEAAAKDKKDKKEKKKKEKKEKKKKGAAEGEEGEEGAEDTKKKKKKEKKKKEKEDLPEMPSKKLPRKKVVAISLFFITIGIVITFLAFMYPYSQDMKKAKKFYSTGEYQKTYEYMRGHKLTEEDQLLYDKTTTLLRIKRPYDSYQNYMKMGLRMEALNALVQGIQMIDRYAEDAASLGIIDKYSQLSRKIYDELYNTFGVTVDRARSWIEIEGTPEYTRALYECLLDTSGVRPEYNENSVDLPSGDDNSVINAEENDL